MHVDDTNVNHFHEKIVFTFFKTLREALNKIDPTLNQNTSNLIHQKIFSFIDLHLGQCILDRAMGAVFYEKTLNPTLKTKARIKWQKLRESLKKIAWLRAFVIACIRRQKKLTGENTNATRKSHQKFLYCFPLIREATDEQLMQLAQMISNLKSETFQNTERAIKLFNQIKNKKCTLLSAFFSTTQSPLFNALRKQGWKTTAIFHHELKQHTGYNAMTTHETPIDALHYTDAFGQMLFMCKSDNTPILINSETYYSAAWDAINALVLYLVTTVIIQTVRACRPKTHNNIHYLMYDAMKPLCFNCKNIKGELTKFYQAHLQSADKIILNSNGESFIQFLKNCYDIKNPILFFPRYSTTQKNPKERRSFGKNNDEFHMVCITTCLDQKKDGARDTAPEIIRTILQQGIHFHYYHSDPKENVKKFITSISPKYRHLFHEYPVNRNQTTLVNELHQYHIGINPSDYWAIMQGVCSFEDRQYADAQAIYIQSTFPTSAMVYAASGLPVTLPHMLFDCNTFLGETVIPTVLSEFGNLKNHLIEKDLKSLCEIADANKDIAEAMTHIHQIDTFMSSETCRSTTVTVNNPERTVQPPTPSVVDAT